MYVLLTFLSVLTSASDSRTQLNWTQKTGGDEEEEKERERDALCMRVCFLTDEGEKKRKENGEGEGCASIEC